MAVLGVGLIGGSIALAVREHAGAEVVGWDPDPKALAAAVTRGVLAEAAAGAREALRGAAACFLCAPVGALPDLLREALAAAPADCVVSDVGSTKRWVVAATEDERFVGGHPVAGAAGSGSDHARADLFQGAAWYLTPGARSSGLLFERLHRLVARLGAHPIALDAETHDRLLATVSHLPHVLANVLVAQAARTVSEEAEPLPRAGPSFRDLTRVAGANSGIWTDIYLSNAEAIAGEIDETVERLVQVAGLLRGGDRAGVRAWNDAAAADRARLLEADGADGPVRALRVAVPNRPGIVAEVALTLGRAGVNIADMALAPAPDMRSGQVTLWIAGEAAFARAAELVGGLGFPVAGDP